MQNRVWLLLLIYHPFVEVGLGYLQTFINDEAAPNVSCNNNPDLLPIHIRLHLTFKDSLKWLLLVFLQVMLGVGKLYLLCKLQGRTLSRL